MANWEPQYPRQSPRWQPPGIFVNVEFGVSFSPSDEPHTASFNYASRTMEERMRDQSNGERLNHRSLPSILVPGNRRQNHNARRYQPVQQRQREGRLDIRTVEQHERGRSAPPTWIDRNQPDGPTFHVSPVSPATRMQYARRLPSETRNRPLPPVPSLFRLGEDNLPWSAPVWYEGLEHDFPDSGTMEALENEYYRLEDPQRVRDLGTLQQAMMTVDSLDDDGFETWNCDHLEDLPRRPRSIGWAVSSNEPEYPSGPPPPYVVSQWQEVTERRRTRAKSSG